jgi:hypothetical protein
LVAWADERARSRPALPGIPFPWSALAGDRVAPDRRDADEPVALTVAEFERAELLTPRMREKLDRGEPLTAEDFG